jgi:lysozyme family protein
MSAADYQAFVERMIQRYEGGYGWDRNDPGGPTKYGITCFDLAEFMHDTMDSMAHWAPIVQAMSLSTADEIYETKYATACDFNALNVGCDCVVFDFGVNSGPTRAIRYAQRVVGVTADGVLGPITLQGINSYDPRLFINGLCDARLNFMRGLGTWGEFGVGWSARVQDLRVYSLNLAFPPAKTSPDLYTAKIERIPLAFAKAWE